jgi:hypothetical protein
MCDVLLPPGVNRMCDVLLPPGVNQVCDVLLPPGVNPIAVKYMYHFIYHESDKVVSPTGRLHTPGIIPVTNLYWDTMLVAQLVEALRYKPEGREIDSPLCHFNFLLT